MNRDLILHDWLVAGIALAAGAAAGLLLRGLLRWLGRHAERTRWRGARRQRDAGDHPPGTATCRSRPRRSTSRGP
ncbi:hypothetical protein AB0B44_41290, partial [Streptomyces sp. NPDC041003]